MSSRKAEAPSKAKHQPPLGREDLYTQLYDRIIGAINDKTKPKILYVCGQPGTGKTLTVKQVLNGLKENGISFKLADLNALGLPTSDHIFIEACKQISPNGKKTPKTLQGAYKEFETSVKAASKTPIILLIDEFDNIDCQCPRRIVKLYDLFEWPSRYGGRFILILIANTINIPPALAARCGSRLGNSQVIFGTYSWETLREIAMASLPATVRRKMSPQAIDLCVRRAAARKGDARLCLELIKSLVENEAWTPRRAQAKMTYIFGFVGTSPIQRMHLSCKILLMCILLCIDESSASCFATQALDKYRLQFGASSLDQNATEEINDRFYEDINQLIGADIVACSSKLQVEHVGSRVAATRQTRSGNVSNIRLYRSHPNVALPWGQIQISLISAISDLLEGLGSVVKATPLGRDLSELYSGAD